MNSHPRLELSGSNGSSSFLSFDGRCCVEAHVPYKTAVSSPDPAGADLPGLACKSLLEDLL